MFGDLGRMIKLAGELKTKLPELQARLAQSEHTACSGSGAVTATVNGKLALVDIRIDRGLLEAGEADGETLEDLIKAAVAAAQEKANKASEEAVRALTGGMELPGLDGLL